MTPARQATCLSNHWHAAHRNQVLRTDGSRGGIGVRFSFRAAGLRKEKRFVFIETPEYAPLVFLQSLRTPSLCFLAIPVLTADPNYKLEVSLEDRSALGLDPACQPRPGQERWFWPWYPCTTGFPPPPI